jgi:hypothetical protein
MPTETSCATRRQPSSRATGGPFIAQSMRGCVATLGLYMRQGAPWLADLRAELPCNAFHARSVPSSARCPLGFARDQFRVSFNSGSSQPKQVSRSARRRNAFVHAGSSFAYCSSACTVSSIKPPTVPSESSTPPRDNLSSSRKRSLMSRSRRLLTNRKFRNYH